MQASSFIAALKRFGFTHFIGVPCSILSPLINEIISRKLLRFVVATNEGEAVAIATGLWLAGAKPVVFSQNSGLGNMINPITSLNVVSRIPLFILVTLRGEPGHPDAPQHSIMGQVTHELLDLVHVAYVDMPKSIEQMTAVLRDEALPLFECGRSFALIIPKGSFDAQFLVHQIERAPMNVPVVDLSRVGNLPKRSEVIYEVANGASLDDVIVSTTGKCSRELFHIFDRPQNFYTTGAMGSASSIGLGIAMQQKDRRIFVLDGDGAALMKLGSWATIAGESPENFIHVVLDNGTHDTTGGQPTAGRTVDFASVGAGCGYRHVFKCNDLVGLADALRFCRQKIGPHLIHADIDVGSIEGVGRPTLTPIEIAQRFKASISSSLKRTAV